MDADPMLVDEPDPINAPTTEGDVHLQAGSPCIDSGNNTAVTGVTTDFEREGRIIDGDHDGRAIVDLGADELLSNIIYVDANVSGGGDDGSSWADAFDTLQEGLDAASSGDEVWVAQGTYKPSAWPNGGTTEREKHFSLRNRVQVYGGFQATETQRNERDWQENATILSGDIGVAEDDCDNCHQVFYHPYGTNVDGSAVLDGFTITEGNASESWPHSAGGGGVFNRDCSPTFNKCTFSANSAYQSGGGMSNSLSSSPTLTNCSFSGNSAHDHGGGIRNYHGSSPTLTSCILWTDSAGSSGDEVYNQSSSPTFSHCDIEGSGGSAAWDTGLGTDAGNNIEADPLFVDQRYYGAAPTTVGDLHLQMGSPCIDSASNAAVVGITTDFDGEPRITDGDGDTTATVDIGADEFPGGDGDPSVASSAATLVEETTATLHGMVLDDDGEPCQYRFQYDTDSGQPYAYSTSWMGSTVTGESFSEVVSGLSKGTTYYFVAQAKNNAGTSSGSELMFLTKPNGPTAFTATATGQTQIDLSWTKGDEAQKTKLQRKQGGYPSRGDACTEMYFDVGAATSDTGLSPGTSYYYRAWSCVQGSEQWSDSYAEDWATTASEGLKGDVNGDGKVNSGDITKIERIMLQMDC